MRYTALVYRSLRHVSCSDICKINAVPFNFQNKCSYTDIIKSFKQKCVILESNYSHSDYIGLLNEVKDIRNIKTKGELEIYFRNLTNKTLHAVENSEDLYNILVQYVDLDWKSSARDLLPKIASSLTESQSENLKPDNKIKYAVNAFELLSQIKLLDSQLTDYIIFNIKSTTNSEFARLILSISTYGLRAKNILDDLYDECLERINSLDTKDTMMIIKGLSEFAIDFKEFFKLQIKKLSNEVNELSDGDKKLLLNMCRALHYDPAFEQLKDSISKYLLANVDGYSIDYLIDVLPYLSRGSKSNSSRALVCQTLIKLFNDEHVLNNCTVEQLSNILESVAWWKIRSNLINRILSILATRINEVKNAKNLGLFLEIYNSINAMTWFHHPFMISSAQFVREPNLMFRISPFQFTRILQTFNKLRYYDKQSYEAMLEYISSDFDSLTSKLNQLSDVLLAAADANISAHSFYKRCTKYIYPFFKKMAPEINENNALLKLENVRIWPRDIANLSWSFTVLGYHKTPDFIPLIELLLLPQIVPKLTAAEVEMVLHCAEACIIECTNIPKLMLLAQDISQIYNRQLEQIKKDQDEILSEVKSDEVNSTSGKFTNIKVFNHSERNVGPWKSRHQSLYSEFHLRGRLRASRQIQNTLKHMGVEDMLCRVTPHFSSPNIIDICFSKENKKGIVILGGNFLMRDSTTGDWNYTETGFTVLQRRILGLQKWKIYEIGCSSWSQIDNLQDRKKLLAKALDHLEIEIPEL